MDKYFDNISYCDTGVEFGGTGRGSLRWGGGGLGVGLSWVGWGGVQ